MKKLILLSMVLAACGGDKKPADAPPSSDAPVSEVNDSAPDGQLDDSAPDGQVAPSPLRVGKVESEDELIGGEGAYGQVGGAWLLQNEVARFLVQDIGVAVGLDLYGGNLIDADLVRPEGTPGNDRFREIFPSAGFLILAPETITVEDDGADGQRVVLRVEGTLEKSRILDLLDNVADDLALTARQDYVLESGSRSLRMITTLFNPDPGDVAVTVGDFLGFGDQLTLFTREAGFESPESAGLTGILAARGEGVSYAYGAPTGGFTFPFSDESGTFGILDYAFVVPGGGEASFERHLVVGDGSLSSVIDTMVLARGDEHGLVRGQVLDPDGDPIEGARVTIIGDDPENQALSDEEGRFEMTATVGSRVLVASAPGRARSADTAVEVSADAEADASLEVGHRARLEVRYTTEGPNPSKGQSAPVKVSLEAVDAEAPDPRLGESDVSGQRRMEFMGGGHDGFDVKPGTYRVVVSRGPEFDRAVHEDVVITDTVTVEGHLARRLDTAGWAGCDFHQHTTGSLDAEQSLVERLRENMTAGLDCAAITDHDNVNPPGPAMETLGADPAFHAVTSNEISVNGVGHFNAYPLPWDPTDPYALVGAQLWADRTIPELFAILRELEGERIIQINHPRSDAFKGYFAFLAQDPSTGESNLEAATDFDAVEVNGSLGSADQYTLEGWAGWIATPNSSVPVLVDWFGMLNRGEPICAVGNSDTHDVGDDAGYPRTYLRVLDDSPEALTDDDVVTAIARQHAIVSRGLVVEVMVNGAFQMGHTQVVSGSGDTPVALNVRVLAPPWLESTASIELYSNGLHLETRQAAVGQSETLIADETFSLTPDGDSWYVVVIRGSGNGRPVFGGAPYAYTNPVYVDGDGDGSWTAPGPITP